MTDAVAVDPFDVALALRAPSILGVFNEAGVLSTSDVHVALTLARLGAVEDEAVWLGAALAARAPRLGSVCVDLGSIAESASADTDVASDLGALPWPDPASWVDHMARQPAGRGGPAAAPGGVEPLPGSPVGRRAPRLHRPARTGRRGGRAASTRPP